MRGAVLAGGAASRYGGRPKGLLEVGGRRILDRVVDSVAAAVGSPPLLVANAPDAATWSPGLHCVPDVRTGAGSLGGIYTAVCGGAGPVLCVAWDMPFVSGRCSERWLAEISAIRCLPPGKRWPSRRGAAVRRLWPRLPHGDRAGAAIGATSGPSPSTPPCGQVSLSLDRVGAFGDPGTPVLQHQSPRGPRAGGRAVAATRIISIIGRKDAGKTTLSWRSPLSCAANSA